MKKAVSIFAVTVLISGCALKQHDVSIYKNKSALAEKLAKDDSGWVTYSDGNKYKGEMNGPFAEGQGELQTTNGDIFIGEFKQGKVSGQVTIRYANGDEYTGRYSKDNLNGIGKYTHANGKVREGKFESGELISGTLTAANGEIYKGTFSNEMLNGGSGVVAKGQTLEFIDSSGNRYQGSFADNLKNGIFIYKPVKGKDEYQLWEQDELLFSLPGPKVLSSNANSVCPTSNLVLLEGSCTADTSEFASYLSKVKNVILSGEFIGSELVNGATLDLRDFELKYGTWANGKLDGEGAVYNDGYLSYEGEFSAGKRNGNGVCIVNTEPVECQYFMGKRVDSGYLKQQLNADLKELAAAQNKDINAIKAETRDIKNEFERKYKARLRRYEREIESAEAQNFTQGMLSTTAAMVNGASDAQARNIAQSYVDNIERIRQKIEAEKLEYTRTQREREEAWFEEQERKLEINADLYAEKERILIIEHKTRCLEIPNKTWNAESLLCES